MWHGPLWRSAWSSVLIATGEAALRRGQEGGWVTLEAKFRCCSAETDVIAIAATADSTVTQRRPFHVPCTSAAAPGLCLPNPIHPVASHGRLPDTCTRSSASSSSVSVSFFKKCFHTWVPLYRYTSSHVEAANANRCVVGKWAEKNRSPMIGPAV